MSDTVVQPDAQFMVEFGPWAVVTGASSGIGRAFAKVLAAKGLQVVLIARRRQRLDDLAAKLQAEHGIETRICEIDLSDVTAPQRILDETADLDIGLVVSNAGFGLKGEHSANNAAQMTDMLMVNCNVPTVLAHGFIPRLRARTRGGIVFTSSVEGLMGTPYSAAYSATKALVVALGEALWAELAPEGIKILTLCPGPTDTEAGGLQGMDINGLPDLMSPEEVARLTLENIDAGPTYISSVSHRAIFERMLAMPRREVLGGMAQTMKELVARK